jgi:hypothetical protein
LSRPTPTLRSSSRRRYSRVPPRPGEAWDSKEHHVPCLWLYRACSDSAFGRLTCSRAPHTPPAGLASQAPATAESQNGDQPAPDQQKQAFVPKPACSPNTQQHGSSDSPSPAPAAPESCMHEPATAVNASSQPVIAAAAATARSEGYALSDILHQPCCHPGWQHCYTVLLCWRRPVPVPELPGWTKTVRWRPDGKSRNCGYTSPSGRTFRSLKCDITRCQLCVLW